MNKKLRFYILSVVLVLVAILAVGCSDDGAKIAQEDLTLDVGQEVDLTPVFTAEEAFEFTYKIDSGSEHIKLEGNKVTALSVGKVKITVKAVKDETTLASGSFTVTIQHTFATEWSKDADGHWHAATCTHTDEKGDYAAHTWDEGTVTTAPTVETDGVKTFTCTVCGQTKTEVIPAGTVIHTHTFAAEWSKDAEGHWHAATCAHTDEKGDYAAHTWDAGTVTTEATAVADGVKTFTCTVCGQTKTEVIPAGTVIHTHTFAAEWSKDVEGHWHAATCTHTDEKGSYAVHTWDAGTVTTVATVAADGVKTFTCTVCGQTKTDVIPKIIHTHVDGEWIVVSEDNESGNLRLGDGKFSISYSFNNRQTGDSENLDMSGTYVVNGDSFTFNVTESRYNAYIDGQEINEEDGEVGTKIATLELNSANQHYITINDIRFITINDIIYNVTIDIEGEGQTISVNGGENIKEKLNEIEETVAAENKIVLFWYQDSENNEQYYSFDKTYEIDQDMCLYAYVVSEDDCSYMSESGSFLISGLGEGDSVAEINSDGTYSVVIMEMDGADMAVEITDGCIRGYFDQEAAGKSVLGYIYTDGSLETIMEGNETLVINPDKTLATAYGTYTSEANEEGPVIELTYSESGITIKMFYSGMYLCYGDAIYIDAIESGHYIYVVSEDGPNKGYLVGNITNGRLTTRLPLTQEDRDIMNLSSTFKLPDCLMLSGIAYSQIDQYQNQKQYEYSFAFDKESDFEAYAEYLFDEGFNSNYGNLCNTYNDSNLYTRNEYGQGAFELRFFAQYSNSEDVDISVTLTYYGDPNGNVYSGLIFSVSFQPCESHIDEDADDYCDNCGFKMPCINHIDEDDNGYCDNCGFQMPCEHYDEDDNGYCDKCGFQMPCINHIDEDDNGYCDKCQTYLGGSEHYHYDIDADGLCDNCGFQMPCEHYDFDANGSCDNCGKSLNNSTITLN